MGESRRLVHGTGWWWTFLVLFLLQLVVGAVSFALGLIPFIGAVATIVLYPFVLTYIVGMYFQARSEGQLVDAVLGWPRQAPAGPPALSLIHISEPTRLGMISYAVFCLKKKKNK